MRKMQEKRIKDKRRDDKTLADEVKEGIRSFYMKMLGWIKPSKAQPVYLQALFLLLKLPVVLLVLLLSPVVIVILVFVFFAAL